MNDPRPASPDPDADFDATRFERGPSAVRSASWHSTAPLTARFPEGTVLAGRFRLHGLIGRGGMGEVYRAEDLKLNQAVALKFLPAEVENDPEMLRRFLNEARLARRISHPNVCRVYDVEEDAERHFLSMELLEGEDLRTVLQRVGRLAPERALRIGREICAGLAAAHAVGVLHRDLKPSNLILDDAGRVHLSDFGLAGLAGELHGHEAVSGTPAYMAPEQHAGGEITVQTDLYALGVLLYELFTGHRPFGASSRAELADAHRTQIPAPPSRWVAGLPLGAEEMILCCLEKEPSARPASARQVAEALDGRAPEPREALRTLVLCDLVGSTRIIEEVGDREAAALFRRHDRAARDLLAEAGGREIDKTDGFLLLFERPVHAVRFALGYLAALRELSEEISQDLDLGIELAVRVGIHLGEVVLQENSPADVARGAKPLEVEGLAKPMAARLMTLAAAGQILLTRGAFDLARRGAVGEHDLAERLRWMAHGYYALQGVEEPTEIFEVGVEGQAPLSAPADSDKAHRAGGDRDVLGWRPAAGLEIPLRPQWVVERKLGEGGFGEVWLARHRKTRAGRVFKFCYEARRLKALKREITLFRLLDEHLGERDDINRILEWNFDSPPYFLESELVSGGSMLDWAARRGGIEAVPLEDRLEIIAQAAEALAAAHSVGVLHKDVKPGNILIATGRDGCPRVRLTDFGVGMVVDRERLAEAGITALGITGTDRESYSGTPLYMAPEILEGKTATIQADIYALGVVLFQAVVGNFQRSLAAGWERDVEDELLLQDIAEAVDGEPQHRLSDAQHLAESLRALPERHAARAAERLERERRELAQIEAEQAVLALAKARKRRKLVATAITVLLAFSLGMARLAYQLNEEQDRAELAIRQATEAAIRANREAVRANREAERAAASAASAEQLSELLVTIFEASDPGEVLDLGAASVARQLEGQPEIQARLMSGMARIYGNLGLVEEGLALGQAALDLRRGLPPEARGPAVAQSLVVLAQLESLEGDWERAELLAREALELRRGALGQHPDAGYPEVAESLEALATVRWERGATDEAEALYREALTLRRQLLSDEDPQLAVDLHNLALLAHARGSLEEAEAFYREALEVRRRSARLASPPSDATAAVAESLVELARLELDRGDFVLAEGHLREALTVEIGRRPEGDVDLLRARGLLGASRVGLERFAAAEPLLLGSLDGLAETQGEAGEATQEILARVIELYEAWGKEKRAQEYRRRLAALR